MARPHDDRLTDTPMEPVRCATCAARVLARKSSWHQTSIQWDSAAATTCAERALAPGAGRGGQPLFDTCGALRDAIRAAAVTGALRVAGDEWSSSPL